MAKQLSSPVSHFSGTVVVKDPLPLMACAAWSRAIKDALALDEPTIDEVNLAFLPGVFACVEAWDIANLPKVPTLETFPGSPSGPRAEFVSWIVGEIAKVYKGEQDVPLAL